MIRRIKAEQGKRDLLVQFSTDLARANEIRKLIALAQPNEKPSGAWIAWANSIADFHDPSRNGKFDQLQSEQGLDASLNCDEDVVKLKFPLPEPLKQEIQRLLEP